MTVSENIAALSEIEIEIQVNLDRKIMRLAEILELTPGSVIRLTRSAGENIDVVAGGTLLGFGEIVIIEDTMGVRITDFNAEH
jgi:flagellar motor switch protein FliN/FliY